MGKTCVECREFRSVDCFYKHKGMKDGRLNKCINCVKARVSKYRQKNIEAVRAYDRARGNRQTDEYRRDYRNKNSEILNAKQREYRKRIPDKLRVWAKNSKNKHPEKIKARRKLGRAKKSGVIIPQPCRDCGADKVHGHHPDYSKPLEVVWLCPSCHSKEHGKAD